MIRRHAMLLIALACFGLAGWVRGPLEDEALAGKIRQPKAADQKLTFDEFVVTRLTGGFRALFINSLWMQAMVAEENYQYDELTTIYNRLTTLEPRYPDAWRQIVNTMAFQLTADPETPEENWKWIDKAIDTARQGVRFNPDDATLPEALAQIYGQKMTQDVVVMRQVNGQSRRVIGPDYIRMLYEKEGHRYYEEQHRWLEEAMTRTRPGIATPRLLSAWYTVRRFKALAAGDRAVAERYQKKYAEVAHRVLEIPGYEPLYDIIMKEDPKDLGKMLARFSQMVQYNSGLMIEEQVERARAAAAVAKARTDTRSIPAELQAALDRQAAVIERYADERWSWLGGAYELAQDFLKSYKRQEGDEMVFAHAFLDRAQLAHVIFRDPALTHRFAKAHSKVDPAALAGGMYDRAVTGFQARLGQPETDPKQPHGGAKRREAWTGWMESLIGSWIWAGDRRDRSRQAQLDEQIDRFLDRVKKHDEDRSKRFRRRVWTAKVRTWVDAWARADGRGDQERKAELDDRINNLLNEVKIHDKSFFSQLRKQVQGRLESPAGSGSTGAGTR